MKSNFWSYNSPTLCVSPASCLSPLPSLPPPPFPLALGPPLQSLKSPNTSRDLVPESRMATGLEVFTQKSLAASPEVTICPPTPPRPTHGLERPILWARWVGARFFPADGSLCGPPAVMSKHPNSSDCLLWHLQAPRG